MPSSISAALRAEMNRRLGATHAICQNSKGITMQQAVIRDGRTMQQRSISRDEETGNASRHDYQRSREAAATGPLDRLARVFVRLG
jgi:hypothetical protein